MTNEIRIKKIFFSIDTKIGNKKVEIFFLATGGIVNFVALAKCNAASALALHVTEWIRSFLVRSLGFKHKACRIDATKSFHTLAIFIVVAASVRALKVLPALLSGELQRIVLKSSNDPCKSHLVALNRSTLKHRSETGAVFTFVKVSRLGDCEAAVLAVLAFRDWNDAMKISRNGLDDLACGGDMIVPSLDFGLDGLILSDLDELLESLSLLLGSVLGGAGGS